MKLPQPMILNVDDNEAGRYAITRTLERSNFQVKEAASGREALNAVLSEPFDLVILDVNLPDINGIEVCRRIKAEPRTAAIPVLHLTASSVNGADHARGLEAGADSYLTEPVEPEVLVATVRALLRARKAEESARTLGRDWQATFDALKDGVALLNIEGRIQRTNRSMARILGNPPVELTGHLMSEFWVGLPREKQPFIRALQSGKRETIEFEFGDRQLSVTADPILDESGAPRGAVELVSDITEKCQLEAQFRESQKFETIGTLAAGVAHDFNNLLTSMMGNASLVLTDLPADSPSRERLQDVVRAGQRAADLTRQLLAYSGKGRHFMQPVDLSAMLVRVQNLIEASVPKKVKLELHLAENLPQIEADAGQIQQVLLNLVSNAAEAIGEGTGCITIRTGLAEDWVLLEIRDDGCGMDGETRARIFDPFFTTKFTGRGLGLAAVSGIVRSHKGAIEVESAPGEGSTFRVLFPMREEAAQPYPIPIVEAQSGTTVLVVDDEEMVRRIAMAALENEGYRVLLAENGAEAIREVREKPEIGIVLLDLTMPVMGGAEAIGEILAARPGIRVIVSTGYDHREAVARFSRRHVAGYLQKPYTARQLTDKVKSVVQSGVAIRQITSE